jgi:hypothetical protein
VCTQTLKLSYDHTYTHTLSFPPRRWPTVDYIASKPEIIFAAFKGYENEEIALNTGMIVREMLRHESLCKILLGSEQ